MMYNIILILVLLIIALLSVLRRYQSRLKEERILNLVLKAELLCGKNVNFGTRMREAIENARLAGLHNYSSEFKNQLQTMFSEACEAELERFDTLYPDINDSDKLIFCLIGCGISPDDIALITQRSSKTIYNRRQMIANAIGIPTSQLDAFALNFIGSNQLIQYCNKIQTKKDNKE